MLKGQPTQILLKKSFYSLRRSFCFSGIEKKLYTALQGPEHMPAGRSTTTMTQTLGNVEP